MQTATATEWVRLVGALEDGFGATVVVAGEDAEELAEALRRSGAPPLAVAGGNVAVLSSEPIDGDVASLDDLGSGIADLIVLRRAWPDRAAIPVAIRAAYRVARSGGGRLVAADIDVDRLLESSSIRYPSRLQYALLDDPALRSRLRSTRMPVSIEAGRAGFRHVQLIEIDEERAVYPDARSYWEAVREEGWPALAELPADAVGALLEEAAAELGRISPVGPVVDRRPWFVVSGTKR